MDPKSDLLKQSNDEPHTHDTIFKIDHMVVINATPMYKILIKLALWVAVLWVCIIVIIYIIDTPASCSETSHNMLNFPDKHDHSPRTYTEQLIILYNDDGQQLE